MTTRPGHCQPQKLPSHKANPSALNLPYYTTNTVTQCKPPIERFTEQTLLALPQHYTAPTVSAEEEPDY